jgi:formate dehydrogenase subunit beta
VSKMLRIQQGAEEGIRDLLKHLLESGKVKGVFALGRVGSNGALGYSLFTDPTALDDAVPLHPQMPANAGKLLSRLTLIEGFGDPIAAVLRPCELRAFAELVKRRQGSTQNILTISSTCAGVYPLEMGRGDAGPVDLGAYWSHVGSGDLVPDVRPTCRACRHYAPYTSDMTVSLIGEGDLGAKTTVVLHTEKAESALDGYAGERSDGDLDRAILDRYGEKTGGERTKLFGEIAVADGGLAWLVDTYGRCISCHGCSKVCPVCYCRLCDFESKDHDYPASTYEAQVAERGAMRVPSMTTLFQLGRMCHMAISCVGCGMCSDVCPVDIPVATIFSKVADSIQGEFDYVPGKDIEEPMPLTKFEIDEFAEVGEKSG